MIKLSSQDLEICYILSRIFDFGTDYKASLRHNHKLVQECKEILQDARHTEEFKGHYHEVLVRIESREREIALESVREKYIEIKNKGSGDLILHYLVKFTWTRCLLHREEPNREVRE